MSTDSSGYDVRSEIAERIVIGALILVAVAVLATVVLNPDLRKLAFLVFCRFPAEIAWSIGKAMPVVSAIAVAIPAIAVPVLAVRRRWEPLKVVLFAAAVFYMILVFFGLNSNPIWGA